MAKNVAYRNVELREDKVANKVSDVPLVSKGVKT